MSETIEQLYKERAELIWWSKFLIKLLVDNANSVRKKSGTETIDLPEKDFDNLKDFKVWSKWVQLWDTLRSLPDHEQRFLIDPERWAVTLLANTLKELWELAIKIQKLSSEELHTTLTADTPESIKFDGKTINFVSQEQMEEIIKKKKKKNQAISLYELRNESFESVDVSEEELTEKQLWDGWFRGRYSMADYFVQFDQEEDLYIIKWTDENRTQQAVLKLSKNGSDGKKIDEEVIVVGDEEEVKEEVKEENKVLSFEEKKTALLDSVGTKACPVNNVEALWAYFVEGDTPCPEVFKKLAKRQGSIKVWRRNTLRNISFLSLSKENKFGLFVKKYITQLLAKIEKKRKKDVKKKQKKRKYQQVDVFFGQEEDNDANQEKTSKVISFSDYQKKFDKNKVYTKREFIKSMFPYFPQAKTLWKFTTSNLKSDVTLLSSRLPQIGQFYKIFTKAIDYKYDSGKTLRKNYASGEYTEDYLSKIFKEMEKEYKENSWQYGYLASMFGDQEQRESVWSDHIDTLIASASKISDKEWAVGFLTTHNLVAWDDQSEEDYVKAIHTTLLWEKANNYTFTDFTSQYSLEIDNIKQANDISALCTAINSITSKLYNKTLFNDVFLWLIK